MTDRRINYLAVLKYHPEYLMETKVEDVMSEFIAVKDIRLRQFGYDVKLNINVHIAQSYTRVF